MQESGVGGALWRAEGNIYHRNYVKYMDENLREFEKIWRGMTSEERLQLEYESRYSDMTYNEMVGGH